ncbi:DEAD/DEAH box helicase family protein [Weeksellaceae bacterium TAE3-ERU29]|nr:DEAD/DEAH box helicase family protein [Weeksellaceae bacterium TAE3-ERU29]
MGLKEIKYPESLRYSFNKKEKPYEFYCESFSNSNKIKFLLGYFSSNAFQSLIPSFCQFLLNEGEITFVMNHIVSKDDYEELFNCKVDEAQGESIDIFKDIKEFRDKMSRDRKFFFNCLRYLKNQGRLKFIVIRPKGSSMSHYKEALFYDGEDCIFSAGSANFTCNGLLGNAESISINRSWGEKSEKCKIKEFEEEYREIENQESKKYEYLNADQLNVIDRVSEDKTLNELIEDGVALLSEMREKDKDIESILKKQESKFRKKVEELENKPRFPYPKPRDYQVEAYNNWVENGYKGIFAMATGTGKTLTALNCVIEESVKSNQNILVVVPGKELVEQWEDELRLCNFKKPILLYSGNKNIKKDRNSIKLKKYINFENLNIITTYDTFKSKTFQSLIEDIIEKFILIFDECHNMGAHQVMKALKNIEDKKIKKIGLSATPIRIWDEDGENEFIEDFFDSKPPYTYEYSMEDAIKNGFLCKYKYRPYFASFNNDEWEEYMELTKQIPKAKEGEKINTTAALKRQLLKDQIASKKIVLKEVIKHIKESFVLDYNNTIVYCMKGSNNETEEKYIYELQDYIKEEFPEINTATFTSETEERDLLLQDFENEKVSILYAIKCLDEGVNIPKVMNAIFLANGQNYREYVQRRGRVLRNYSDAETNFVKEYAHLFDVLAMPTVDQFNSNRSTGLNLIVSEFKRLYEFYKNAEQEISVFNTLDNELKKYGLTKEYIKNKILKNEQ